MKVFVGPWKKVETVIKDYEDGDYDFGVDCATISSITGLDLDESKKIVVDLAKNDSGM